MHLLWIIFLLALGACIGSFLNVVIYRLPRGQSIVFPGSHCPFCGRPIRWYDNIPIVSYLVLGARCRDCKVPISSRYLVIEAATAARVVGLYVCYYMLNLRHGAGSFLHTWPAFLAHATLLCGLLAASVVDLELYLIPLEVMWFCSLVGVAMATWRPCLGGVQGGGLLTPASPVAAAVALAAVLGLAIAYVLMRFGFIQPSFLDAEESSAEPAPQPPPSAPPRPKKKAAKTDPAPPPPSLWRMVPRLVLSILSATVLASVPFLGKRDEQSQSVAFSAENGVNPRKEILRELIFLSPAIILALGAAIVLGHCRTAHDAWFALFDKKLHPALASHLTGLGSAVFGYVIGGLWVWGVRILGTLALGKEAMGMGDVHILAAIGAVTGWVVPSITFFVAPLIGLLWAAILRKRELPFGPSLALASLVVMLFYDPIVEMLAPMAAASAILFR